MRPTFSSFITAQTGLNAARSNLSVTGQNMTNARSIGYTRQRVDLFAIGSSGNNMRYANKINIGIGEGVNIASLTQIRDPYLDVRYREQNTKVAGAQVKLDCMTDLRGVLDEIQKQDMGIGKQLADVLSQLQHVSKNPLDKGAEILLQTSSTMLSQMFNQYSEQLKTVRAQQTSYLQEGAVAEINELLTGIAKLNVEIKEANIGGNPALELLDSRNVMVDQLSTHMDISVAYDLVDVGSGVKVEEMSIFLVGDKNTKFNIIDNGKAKSIELEKNAATGGPIQIKLKNDNGFYVANSDNGLIELKGGNISDQLNDGSLNGFLKMLNNSGEFENPPSTERGIAYYDKMLNTLAKEFAGALNEANKAYIAPPGVPADRPLFAARANPDGTIPTEITASNIMISLPWKNSTDIYITTSKIPDVDGNIQNGANDNILSMIAIFSKDVQFRAPSLDGGITPGAPLYKGTFQNAFTNISGTLAMEYKDVENQFKSYDSVMTDLTKMRDSISSVDMEEEGINLIMFNQALTASSRFMTTIDEAVETIITRMGLVGR